MVKKTCTITVYDTIEYICFWGTFSNPDFNVREFEYIRNEADTNRPQRFETLHQMTTGQLALLDRSVGYR